LAPQPRFGARLASDDRAIRPVRAGIFARALCRTRTGDPFLTIEGPGRHRSPRCPGSPMDAGHVGLEGTSRTGWRDPEGTQSARRDSERRSAADRRSIFTTKLTGRLAKGRATSTRRRRPRPGGRTGRYDREATPEVTAKCWKARVERGELERRDPDDADWQYRPRTPTAPAAASSSTCSASGGPFRATRAVPRALVPDASRGLRVHLSDLAYTGRLHFARTASDRIRRHERGGAAVHPSRARGQPPELARGVKRDRRRDRSPDARRLGDRRQGRAPATGAKRRARRRRLQPPSVLPARAHPPTSASRSAPSTSSRASRRRSSSAHSAPAHPPKHREGSTSSSA
jgi:hypothetical protein